MAAFQSAIDKGADIIEFDVHETKDGEIVVHHDYYIDRCTNGSGFIGNFLLGEIQEIDAGAWFSKKFSGERIPSLEEILESFAGKVNFEVEIKSPSKTLCRKVLALVEHYDLVSKTAITSFHDLVPYYVKQIQPKISTGLFFYGFEDWMEIEVCFSHIIGKMDLAHANMAHLNPVLLNRTRIAMLKDRGFKVHVACNDIREKLNECFILGVDQFSTNFLDEAISIRKSFTNA